MSELLDQIALCVEFGKVNKHATFPQSMKGLPGVEEYTHEAIEKDFAAVDILNALISGMEKIGVKFKENKVFVPEVLMAAKAMSTAMKLLNPFFQQGKVKQKGTLIIGTVYGDLHDIGKNLVAMIVEGSGWKIIDLGTGVTSEKFIKVIEENPGCFVALSALLTTTMVNMEKTVAEIKTKYPEVKILVGGAPVTEDFSKKIGADFYSYEPLGAVDYLNSCVA